MGLYLVRKSAPGGMSVRVDVGGFEIIYSGGKMDHISFADPNLKLELYDFTGVPPRLASRALPYSVVVRRAQTEIPGPAYGVIYDRLSALGLIIRSARAHTPLVSDSIQPMVHYARGKAQQ
jgi:hypothetical protein